MIAAPRFSRLPSCAFSAHYCRDTVPSECGLTVFLRRRSKCSGQLSPEREAHLPSFSLAPCGFSVRRQGRKEKPAAFLSQPVLEYQGSRLVFQRTAVLRWCRLVPGNCTTVEIKSWWSFSVTATNNVDRWRASPDRRYRRFFPRDRKTRLLMREVSG